MIVPLSFDFGGGIGDGAMAAYNVDDPRNPVEVFDSRDHMEIYHTDEIAQNYLGDIGEMHGLYFHKDMLLLVDRGKSRNGFIILDLAPLYDEDPGSLPQVVSRYYFPGVEKSTVYDGFTFAPAWAGGKYVYAPTGSTGLFIVDTSDLAAPRLLSHLTKGQLYNQVLRSAHAIGDTLVLSPAAVASAKGEMVLLDVSDPEKPSLVNRHPVKVGYQGILYGSRFYNGAFSGEKNKDDVSTIGYYEISDPRNITETELGKTDAISKPEYVYVRDGDLYIGHYPGLLKFENTAEGLKLKASAEPQHPPADDYAFSSPLGNLAISTSDHNVKSKVNISAINIVPDLTPPSLVYVQPENNARNVSIHAKVGLSMSDFIDNQSLEYGAVYIREKGTSAIVGAGYSHGMGIVHAVPTQPLKSNTTYEVVVTPNLMDMVGNAYAGDAVVSVFSTGDQLSDFSVSLKTAPPELAGEFVRIDAVLEGVKDPKAFLYSWDFGDGRKPTQFSNTISQLTRYEAPGNYNVTLAVKKKGLDKVVRVSAVQVITPAAYDVPAQSSSTLFLNSETSRLYVANPDNDTLTAFNTNTGETLFEAATGSKPSALTVNGRHIWVSAKGDDAVTVHDVSDGRIIRTIPLGYGSAPHGLVINAGANRAYVNLTGTDTIQEIDIETYVLERQAVLQGPLRHIAHIPRKNIIVAPQFIASYQQGGHVQWVNVPEFKPAHKTRLKPTLVNDGLSNGRGYPNYLGPIAVNAEQSMIWMPGKKDNLFRGLQREGTPLLFDHTVRSIAVPYDLDREREPADLRIDLDNSDFASAAVYSGLGNILYVATLGSQTVTAIDAYNPQNRSTFSSFGQGPIALASSSDGARLYVHNQLSREIAVLDAKPGGALSFAARWKTAGTEKLSASVLNGKRVFHNSTLSQLTREGYMSCAACHIDGSHDGRIWDLSNLGEGLCNTIDLRGKAGMKHGALHWSGNFDEVQDFEAQVINLNGGTGFLFDSMRRPHRRHFPSNAGLNNDLDDLAAYVSSLEDYPRSPYRSRDGGLTNAAKKGCEHFIAMDCQSCHSGPVYTDSAVGTRHNVGTQKPSSGNRLEKPLEGFDTPSLIGIWDSAPYLHDGSAAKLEDVFKSGVGVNARVHNRAQSLDPVFMAELVSYLKQIDRDGGITAADVGSDNLVPVFEQSIYDFDYVYRFDKTRQHIGTVRAVDPDVDQTLHYEIIPSVHANLFSIDPVTGEIELHFKDLYLRYLSDKFLDVQRRYSIEVIAKDNGDFIQTGKTALVIDVVYPKLPFKNKEFNDYLKLSHAIDSGKKLGKAQQKTFDALNAKVTKIPKEYNRYNFAH